MTRSKTPRAEEGAPAPLDDRSLDAASGGGDLADDVARLEAALQLPEGGETPADPGAIRRLSNVQKTLHDTAKSIINKIR